MDLQKLSEECIELVKEAASFIAGEAKKFSKDMVREKSMNSLVSYVDVESEKLLVRGLQKILPGSGFITEEDTIARTKTEYTWIIDPLDGTTNFIHQIPIYSVSVALQHHDEIILGVVYEITRNECFHAWKNGGAFLNNKKIHVPTSPHLADCVIATGFPYEKFDFLDEYIPSLRYMMTHARAVRRLGSAATDLAYVACGRFDAFYEYNLNAWDIAAGALIVQEAGGVVKDFSGGDNYLFGRELVSGNKEIVEQMLKVIRGASAPNP